MGGLRFFCTTVEVPDGDVELLIESVESVNAAPNPTNWSHWRDGLSERMGGSGHIGKMVFSAGAEVLAIAAYIPEAHNHDVSCVEWITAVLGTFSGTLLKGDKLLSIGIVKANAGKNIYPLKIRGRMIMEANNFSRGRGLLSVVDSDDDFLFGDHGFPL